MDILEKLAQSHSMKEIYGTLQKAAPTNVSILLEGERGTEKELVARSIHNNSLQKDNTFITVNCSTFTDSLPIDYLFGSEKRVNTGSIEIKKGLFEIANENTLFIDEISELFKPLQVKLLKILNNRTVDRIGGTIPIPVNFRLITSSNKILKKEVEKGNFDEGLFYKLSVVKITIPPLRDRQEDIPYLIDYFIKKVIRKSNGVSKVTGINRKAANILYYYDWKGNVSELENIIEQAVVLSNGPLIIPKDIPSHIHRKSDTTLQLGAIPEGLSLPETLVAVEKRMIEHAMQKSRNVQSEAAKILGIGKSGLNQKLKKHKLYKK